MTRRPRNMRLACNVEEISEELMERFANETGMSAKLFPTLFLDWVGLKATPTALKRIKSPTKKPISIPKNWEGY